MWNLSLNFNNKNQVTTHKKKNYNKCKAQSAGAVEYTDCISAEE